MITVNNLKISLDATQNDIKQRLEQLLGVKVLSYKLIRRAVDARKKDNVCFVCNIDVEIAGDEAKTVKKCKNKDIFIAQREKYSLPEAGESRGKNVIVCGSGPAGLFAAYALARAGLCPTVLERGKSVDERKASVEIFKNTGVLDTESNIQFGEGGAGTFSDGKLNTGIKDLRIRFVLETFAEMANGMADDILYMAKPHIGTDRLINIIRNMRQEIIRLGGKFLF